MLNPIRFNVSFAIIAILVVALLLFFAKLFSQAPVRSTIDNSSELELAKIEAKRELLLLMSDVLTADEWQSRATTNKTNNHSQLADARYFERKEPDYGNVHRSNPDTFPDWLCIRLLKLSVDGKLIVSRQGKFYMRVPASLAFSNPLRLFLIKVRFPNRTVVTSDSSSTYYLFRSVTKQITPARGVPLEDVYADLIPIENGNLGEVFWVELFRTSELSIQELSNLTRPDQEVILPECAELVARLPIKLRIAPEIDTKTESDDRSKD